MSEPTEIDPEFIDSTLYNTRMSDYSAYPGTADSGAIGFLSRLEHKSLETKDVPKANLVLEIGGGKGDHVDFMRHEDFEAYYILDLFLPQILPKDSRINFFLGSAEKLPFESETFDRIIMTCVLHHVADPESALMEMKRVLKKNGSISLLISNDPGLLYRLLWKIFARRKRILWENLDPDYGHARSHLISGVSLNVIIEYIFRDFEIKRRGVPFLFPSYHFNLSTVYSIGFTRKSTE
jgi:phosphatidylethanolamine/phosphatidyl-N-methylethanolamine N-methyltransferase